MVKAAKKSSGKGATKATSKSVKKGDKNAKPKKTQELDEEAAARASRYRVKRDAMEPRTKAKSHTVKGVSMDKIEFGTPKKPSKAKPWKVSDFKAASYNPRYITEGRLKKLSKSMAAFGDLSGVVFNQRTNRLVSGHQRLKGLDGCKTEVITKPHTDKHGTVEIGHIRAHTANGAIDIPLRVVDWSENKVEKAANIAANSHGGEFDKDKLQKVLKELDPRQFDVELLGLDPLTIQTLAPLPRVGETPRPKDGPSKRVGDEDDEDGGEFAEFSPDSFDFKCACPRCGYKFDPKSAPAPKTKKEEKPRSKGDIEKAKKVLKKATEAIDKIASKSKSKSDKKGDKKSSSKKAAPAKSTKKPAAKKAKKSRG